jgi:hypothetical protein
MAGGARSSHQEVIHCDPQQTGIQPRLLGRPSGHYSTAHTLVRGTIRKQEAAAICLSIGLCCAAMTSFRNGRVSR